MRAETEGSRSELEEQRERELVRKTERTDGGCCVIEGADRQGRRIRRYSVRILQLSEDECICDMHDGMPPREVALWQREMLSHRARDDQSQCGRH